MIKLSLASISDLNYLFLKETFSIEGIFCDYVLEELKIYLTNIANSCPEKVEEIIKTEMIKGYYFNDISLEQIHYNFKRGCDRVFFCECDISLKAFNKYISLATEVFNKYYY